MTGGVTGGLLVGGVTGGLLTGGVTGGLLTGGLMGGLLTGGLLTGGLTGGLLTGGLTGGLLTGGLTGGLLTGGDEVGGEEERGGVCEACKVGCGDKNVCLTDQLNTCALEQITHKGTIALDDAAADAGKRGHSDHESKQSRRNHCEIDIRDDGGNGLGGWEISCLLSPPSYTLKVYQPL